MEGVESVLVRRFFRRGVREIMAEEDVDPPVSASLSTLTTKTKNTPAHRAKRHSADE
jgi:hypothetical protein